jgi:NAD(P)-dependent dehydrogenase (short-subunit alcohol dehydrogenase family)
MIDVFSLQGKNVLITGASSGIGKEAAIVCGLAQAHVSIVGRNDQRLAETLTELGTQGVHQMIQADLSLGDDIDNIVEKSPVLEGLVLNAGVVKTAPVQFIKKEDLDYLFEVNIKSSIVLVQKLLKKKKLNKGASICFVSSIATRKATVGNAMYNATKGAVNAFTRSLALELAGKRIRVNAVLPGFVQTNIMADTALTEDDLNRHLTNYPLGRFGVPKDVAYLVLYLLSDASGWMTGSLIPIDGGYSLK